MSGPIVRTGTNQKLWDGWDRVFGTGAGTKKTPAKAAKKAPKKAAKKVAKKAPKKK